MTGRKIVDVEYRCGCVTGLIGGAAYAERCAKHAKKMPNDDTLRGVIAAVHDLRDKFRKQPLRRQAAWSSHEMAVLLDEILALGGEQ